jgi:cytochrome P450
MPEGLALWLKPEMKVLIKFFLALEKQFKSYENSKETADAVSPTMLTAMLDSKLPVQERTTQRLFWESRVLFSAGAFTTSTTLAPVTFHLLSNPGILRKLKMEIEAAIPDVNSIPTLHQVENLPYLVRASHNCCCGRDVKLYYL